MNNSFINVILIQMANNLIVYRILIREKYLNLFLLTSSYSISSPPIDDTVMHFNFKGSSLRSLGVCLNSVSGEHFVFS